MSSRRVEVLPWVLALVALGLIGWLTWRELQPPDRSSTTAQVASLTECQGDIRVRDPESLAWSRARSGLAIRAGDAVFAADASSGVIAFAGGEVLVLGPRSMVVIAPPVSGGEATLRQGAAAAVGGVRSLRVNVANATVVAQPSSRVAIGRGANDSLEVFVERGRAEVVAGTGAPGVSVEGGRGLKVAGGQVAPLAAAATLQVPTGGELLLGVPGEAGSSSVEVTWAGAAPGDLVQASRSPDFAAAAVVAPYAAGKARLLLDPGAHMLRIVGPDGAPRSAARFVVVATRSAPSPWQPPPGARVPVGHRVPLFWSERPGATGYRIEVDPAPGAAQSRLEAAAPPVTLEPKVPGRWRWRVCARFAEGDGPWSAWTAFEVADDLGVAPELQAPDLKVLPAEDRRAP